MEQSKFYQIKNITEYEYTLVCCDGSVITRPIQDIDKSASVFNIQDAKDGDVLVDEYNNIGIYKEIEGIYWDSYIYLGCDGNLYDFSVGGMHEQAKTRPATKEQCDNLLKAMADAGWDFDFDKKELKKIKPIDEYEGLTDFERAVADACIGFIGKELGWKQYVKDNADNLLKIAVKKFNAVQNDSIQINPSEYINDMGGNGCYLKNTAHASAWSEEDAEMVEGLNNCLDELEEENGWKYVYVKDKNVELTEIRNWMKALKDRVQPQPKQEWSVEDEDMLDNIIDDYDDADEHNLVDDIGKVMWLKSLKDRVACEANCTTTKEWSEEEESIINKAKSWLDTLCDYLKDSSPEYISDIKDVINKLKSIKDRYTWKPSKEQMNALDSTLQYSQVSHNSFEYLNSLYNDLKQL